MSTGREIRLVENPDGQWTARDVDVGVSAEGVTRDEALNALDVVVEAVTGDGGREPTDEELDAVGVDSDENHPGRGELPDELR